MCKGSESQSPAVATILVPGSEDPSTMLRNGGMKLSWEGSDGRTRTVSKFREQKPKQLVDESLGLPSLYLHFLDKRFYAKDDERDKRLNAGNDNAELRIALPDTYTKSSSVWTGIDGDVRQKLDVVLDFLFSQGEAPSNSQKESVNIRRRIFSLVTARPKSEINIPKDKFGIPGSADLYLFAQNHRSVSFMDADEIDAFETCISELPEQDSTDVQLFATFLKVFFEGGFGYNEKRTVGAGGAYLPVNVGIAALGIVPAFEGQLGISTGYPYAVESHFLQFIDSVEVTITAISEMSERHARYGMCFTRCAFVWEGSEYASNGTLDFCCVVPHGGFFYVPKHMKKYKEIGGLIYAFGEDKESTNVALEQ